MANLMAILSSSELASLERDLGHPFPPIYRDLLRSLGNGRHSSDVTVYHPSEICELYSHHFESDGDLFNRYFPFGCNEAEQAIWLVDVRSGYVATIDHETHPDDYPDEGWLKSDEWRTTVLPVS